MLNLNEMKNIILIGSGNVATHLGIALKNEGYNILQVWSMQVENAKVLADKLDCKFTSSLYDLEEADLYITSVKDDKIVKVISKLQNINIVHTSGSIGLEIFNNNFTNFSGLFDLNNSGIKGNLAADRLNLDFKIDQTGFMRIEIKDSIIPDIEFINSSQSTSGIEINSRLKRLHKYENVTI